MSFCLKEKKREQTPVGVAQKGGGASIGPAPKGISAGEGGGGGGGGTPGLALFMQYLLRL